MILSNGRQTTFVSHTFIHDISAYGDNDRFIVHKCSCISDSKRAVRLKRAWCNLFFFFQLLRFLRYPKLSIVGRINSKHKFEYRNLPPSKSNEFAGDDVSNGIFGALIVKQADIRDPHRALYDIDDPSHVILVSQWQHSGEITFTDGHAKPAILLVNGRGRQPNGPNVPLTKFTVLPGRRYRFRLANAGGAGSCPITVLLDAHPLLLIGLDGQPVEPRQVASITLAKGNSSSAWGGGNRFYFFHFRDFDRR